MCFYCQVKQSSVRQAIGVVPQDTVLFNDNILYNIRYGRVTASDKEVEEAAEAADIHQRIMSFTDGKFKPRGGSMIKTGGGLHHRIMSLLMVSLNPGEDPGLKPRGADIHQRIMSFTDGKFKPRGRSMIKTGGLHQKIVSFTDGKFKSRTGAMIKTGGC